MSKFVSNELDKIDLGDGDFAMVPNSISFADCSVFTSESPDFDQLAKMISNFIKEWNLKEDDGTPVPVTPENVKRLKLETANILQNAMKERMPEHMFDQKKTEQE